MLGCYKKF